MDDNLNISGNLNNNGNITCANNINGETINGGDINSTRSFINGGYLTFTNYNNLVNKVQLFGTGTDMGMVNNKYNAASGGSWSTDWGNEIRFDLTKSKCNLKALQFNDCPQNITSSSDQIYIHNTPTSSVDPSQTNLKIHTSGSLSVRSNIHCGGNINCENIRVSILNISGTTIDVTQLKKLLALINGSSIITVGNT